MVKPIFPFDYYNTVQRDGKFELILLFHKYPELLNCQFFTRIRFFSAKVEILKLK